MFRRDFLTGLFAGLFPVVVGCSKSSPTPPPDGSTSDTTETVEQKCTACAGGGKVHGRCAACNGSGRCPACAGSGGQKCKSCDGKGQIPGRRLNPDCSYCNGTGRTACPKCDGGRACSKCDGKEVQETCPACRGTGAVRVPKP
ncbi:MAG: hypothetical protein KF873_22955 [Gemmataceae bacterium]|nr:hypothetical protein [Gemmataceae bacterium]